MVWCATVRQLSVESKVKLLLNLNFHCHQRCFCMNSIFSLIFLLTRFLFSCFFSIVNRFSSARRLLCRFCSFIVLIIFSYFVVDACGKGKFVVPVFRVSGCCLFSLSSLRLMIAVRAKKKSFFFVARTIIF